MIEVKAPYPGATVAYADIKAALEQHKPAMIFLCQGKLMGGGGSAVRQAEWGGGVLLQCLNWGHHRMRCHLG